MVNKAKKGQRREKAIRDELEKKGWLICFKSIRWRFGCIDFATLFDVVAFKGKERKYVSCKHASNGSNHLQHQKEIQVFKEEHGFPGESYEFWNWTPGRYRGRGANKIWHQPKWDKVII